MTLTFYKPIFFSTVSLVWHKYRFCALFNTVYFSQLTITQWFNAGREKRNMQNIWMEQSSQSSGGHERRFSVITATFAASYFSMTEIRAFMSVWEGNNDGALQQPLHSRAWKGVIRGLRRLPLLERLHLQPQSQACIWKTPVRRWWSAVDQIYPTYRYSKYMVYLGC